MFLIKKDLVSALNVSCQCLIWFKLRCLSKILVIILLKLKIVNIFKFKNLLSDQNLSHFFWSYLYFLALL